MSPETKELFDVLNEQGLDFDDRNDIEVVEYPDVMANNNNNTIENSETDCESCDGISTPKDLKKKTPDYELSHKKTNEGICYFFFHFFNILNKLDM